MAQIAIERPGERAATDTRGWRWFRPGRILLYAVLILIALFFILPLVWLVSTSLKNATDVFQDPGVIPARPTFENYQKILDPNGDTPLVKSLLNSVITAALGTLLTVVLTSLSAYAFARIDFRFKNILFSLLIATLLLPGVMFLIPQFVLVENFFKLHNSYLGFVLPGVAGVFGVFFLRQFFLGIPVELEEAAYVDGAGRLRTLFSVVLPISGPAIATLAVISFLGYWNDYLWPLLICEGDGCPVTPALRNLQGQFTFEYHTLMTGAVVAAVPVLLVYIVAQRYIIQSVASSGVKG